MVTNCEEKGRIKCKQYWPPAPGKSIRFPDSGLLVEFKSEESHGDFVIRELLIDQKRTVYQYHFITWPDHGVPETTEATMRMLLMARKARTADGGPMIVHCSAGVGRTGTLIAIDVNLDKMQAEGVVDVQKTLNVMRRQRNTMVQTEAQYIFIYSSLLQEVPRFLDDGYLKTGSVDEEMDTDPEAEEEDDDGANNGSGSLDAEYFLASSTPAAGLDGTGAVAGGETAETSFANTLPPPQPAAAALAGETREAVVAAPVAVVVPHMATVVVEVAESAAPDSETKAASEPAVELERSPTPAEPTSSKPASVGPTIAAAAAAAPAAVPASAPETVAAPVAVEGSVPAAELATAATNILDLDAVDAPPAAAPGDAPTAPQMGGEERLNAMSAAMFVSANAVNGLLSAKAAAALLAASGLETSKLRQVWNEAKKQVKGSAPKANMDLAEFQMACKLATQLGGSFPEVPKQRKTSLVDKMFGNDGSGDADTAATLAVLAAVTAAAAAGGGAAREAGDTVGDSINAPRPIIRKRGSVRMASSGDGEWQDPLNDSANSPQRIVRGDSLV